MLKDDTLNILAEPVRELVCPDCEHEIDVSGRDMLSPISCPKCAASLSVPARLGDFILVEALGSGGMATVYKAYDSSLGRYVAIKIMRRKFGQDPKFVERFLREARAAARLNHPNVVQIYSCATRQGQPYIVMEYVNGGKFDEMIANDAPLREGYVLDIAIDIANGLRAAADIGLVHGDIKPANIIFDKNGMAKVADFGLAHFAQEEEDRTEIWGTPYYIAPERARKKKQDQRSDIYCLGATLFHALTGQPPFEAETAVDVVMARLKEPAPQVSSIAPEVSDISSKIISRMLELETFKRYPNYNSLISDLERAKEDLSSPSSAKRRKSTVTGKSVASEDRPSRNGLKIFIGLLLAAGLTAAGIFFIPALISEPTPDEPTAEIEREEPVEDVEPIEPLFSERNAERMARIIDDLDPSTTIAAQEQLTRMMRRFADNPLARRWAEIFHAVASMLRSDVQESREYFQRVLEDDSEVDDLLGHQLTISVAEYMLEQRDKIDLDEEYNWQKWQRDLVVFFNGLRSLADGELEDALEHLQEFAELSVQDDNQWAYSAQKLSRDLTTRIAGWKGLEKEIDELVESNDYAAAIARLDLVRSGIFQPLKEARLAQINELKDSIEQERAAREAAERAERERAEEERRRQIEQDRQERIESEMELLTDFDERAQPLFESNRFEDAERILQRLRRQISTDEAEAEFEVRLRKAGYLKNLKSFIIRSINQSPYRGGRDILRGDAILASRNEITVELPGSIGTTEMDWTRVTPRLFVPMVQHYLPRADLDEAEQSLIFIGMAIYAQLHELGNEEVFIRRAESLRPGIADEIGLAVED